MPQSSQTSPTPEEYIDAGFRILRCSADDKRPVVGGFGAADPYFSCPAEDFQPGERVAILLGVCPFASSWGHKLICLDLDHGLSLDAVGAALGVELPSTLTSKGGAHAYYRVRATAARDQLKQWVNALKADDVSKGALDLKWAGGYAIEPGNVPGGWDGGWDPWRIAVLPDEAVQALVQINSSGASEPRDRAREDGTADYDESAVEALTELWPRDDGKCFETALAFGGVMADSDLSEENFRDLAERIVPPAKLRQAIVSFENARAGADVNIKGWPTLLQMLNDIPEALEAFRAGVPGLDRRGVSTPEDAALAVGVERLFASREDKDPERLEIERGDAVCVAEDIIAKRCPGSVYSEGSLWARPSSEDPSAVWTKISESQVSRWVHEYSGAICGHNKQQDPILLAVNDSLIRGAYKAVCDAQDDPDFFSRNLGSRVVFKNGVLNIDTGKLSPAQAEDGIRYALDFDFHADQLERCPPTEWMRFVMGQWGDDAESITLLHQVLGYLLSGRQDQEKMFVFLGPPRCGKGTIIKLLRSIMGEAVGAFKIADLDKTFGMSAMLGKSVLIDPDVRKSRSAFTDTGAIAERLLSITSGDEQAVRLMRQAPVTVTLPGRILVATNPPFDLRDEGGALASRMTILKFSKGFIGKEDRGLLERLRAETPSIVALALAGLTALKRNGKFVEPAAAAQVREEARINQDAMNEWVEDYVVFGEGTTKCQDVLRSAQQWAEQQGLRQISMRRVGSLLARWDIHSTVKRIGGKPVRAYVGISLRKD